jgi:ribosomal protein L22
MTEETEQPDETTEEVTEEPKPRRRRRTRSKVEAADAAPSAAAEEEASADTEEPESPEPAEPEAEESELETDEDEDEELEEEADEEEADEEEADEDEREAKPRSRRPRRRSKAEPAEEKPAAPKPAPRRRRAQRDPNLPPPVVRAQAKYVRSSPRKARLVCDHIRGKTVEEARAILAHAPRAVARDWSKLLESAVANAEHNHELVGEDLYVKAVHADDGPTIKRYRPRAMGRATKIRKRTSHLTILLTPKDE